MDYDFFNNHIKTHFKLKYMLEFTTETNSSEFSEEITRKNNLVRNPNVNDQIFWESLEKLTKCRDLLSLEEENFINNLANKFKYLR
jgi:hypothetical protein